LVWVLVNRGGGALLDFRSKLQPARSSVGASSRGVQTKLRQACASGAVQVCKRAVSLNYVLHEDDMGTTLEQGWIAKGQERGPEIQKNKRAQALVETAEGSMSAWSGSEIWLSK